MRRRRKPHSARRIDARRRRAIARAASHVGDRAAGAAGNPSRARRVGPSVRVLGLCLAVTVAACVTHHFGAGVARDDWRRRRVDADPVADPNREPTGNPWAEHDEHGEHGAAPAADDWTATPAARTVAVALAALAGGWTPLLMWHGTFEETPGVARPIAPPTSP